MLIRCTSLHQRWHLCGWVGSNRSLEMFHAVGMCIWLPKFNEMQRNIPCSNFRHCNAAPCNGPEIYQGQQEVAHLVLPSWRGARNWRSSRARSLGSAKLLLHAEWKMAPWNAQNTSAPVSFDIFMLSMDLCKIEQITYIKLFSESGWRMLKGQDSICWGARQHTSKTCAWSLTRHFAVTFQHPVFNCLNMLWKSMKRMNMLLIFENMAYYFILFPDSGDYAGASFNTYCGWTHMQCEAYVRSKPNDFRRWDCSSWVESNWYVMRSSWAGAWNINLWKVATQSDNQFGWFDMIFHGCFRHSCQIRLCVLSPTYHTRGNAYWGIRRLVFRQENFRKGRGSVQPVASLRFPLCKSIFESCNIIRMVKVIVMIIGDEYSSVVCLRCIFACVYINHYYLWARYTLHRIQLHMYAYINICTRNT